MMDRLAAALAGRYDLEREIGRGGMATVFLARDRKHDREVALKVLHPELAAVMGEERFVREIEIAARLNHPHIVPLHDSGKAGAFLYYVMPYIEGESLRDKLIREGQLPIDQALRIAREAADGLDYAHEHDVVHRDIKPENILLSNAHALIMDFGLATAISVAAGPRLTETGMTLGTPQYMSPEQARGDAHLDDRADQYALACVVYEMLAGDPPHMAPSVQAVMTKVLTQPARPLREVRPSVPAHVEAAVDRAMKKVPADRFRTVRHFAEALAGERAVGWGVGARTGLGAAGPWKAGLVAALALTAVAFWAPWRGPPQPGPVTRFAVRLAPQQALDAGVGRPVAVSPDGRRYVFTVLEGGGSRLYLRAADDFTATAIPGTEGARGPFFCPDGEWVGFFADGRLKKVSLLGGAPMNLAQVDGFGSASWGDDGTIVFGGAGTGGGVREGLLGVPEDGGTPEPWSAADLFPDRTREYHWAPEQLPGGRGVLFTASGLPDRVGIAVRLLDTGEQRMLIEDGAHPRYLPGGRLLFARGADLYVVPFDAHDMEVTGPAVLALEGVSRDGPDRARFDVSDNGTLVYVPSGPDADSASPASVDRPGPVAAVEGPAEFRVVTNWLRELAEQL